MLAQLAQGASVCVQTTLGPCRCQGRVCWWVRLVHKQFDGWQQQFCCPGQACSQAWTYGCVRCCAVCTVPGAAEPPTIITTNALLLLLLVYMCDVLVRVCMHGCGSVCVSICSRSCQHGSYCFVLCLAQDRCWRSVVQSWHTVSLAPWQQCRTCPSASSFALPSPYLAWL